MYMAWLAGRYAALCNSEIMCYICCYIVMVYAVCLLCLKWLSILTLHITVLYRTVITISLHDKSINHRLILNHCKALILNISN